MPITRGGDLIRFLIARQVVRSDDVVDRNVQVVTRVRERYALHNVSIDAAPRCVVKTAREPSARPWLVAEGVVLDFVQRHPRLRGIAPACLARDPVHGAVVMEWLTGAVPDSALNTADPVRVGRMIGALHRETVGVSAGLTADLPPVFGALLSGLTSKPEVLGPLWSLASHPYALVAALRAAAAGWQRQAWIHTDVKREHWLARAQPHDSTDPCLIDWELTRFGDPAWDAGSAVHEHLSAPIDQPVGDPRSLPPVPAPARVFLREYTAAAGPTVIDATFPFRTALYSGVRLTQTALEMLSAGTEPARVRPIVHTAEAIFHRTGTHARTLFA